MRKLCLVGLPVFFVAEGLWQLIFGLLVSFISLGVFCVCMPYRASEDTVLQIICQLCLFFTLLSKIVLADPNVTDAQVNLTQALLVFALAVPPAIFLLVLFRGHLRPPSWMVAPQRSMHRSSRQAVAALRRMSTRVGPDSAYRRAVVYELEAQLGHVRAQLGLLQAEHGEAALLRTTHMDAFSKAAAEEAATLRRREVDLQRRIVAARRGMTQGSTSATAEPRPPRHVDLGGIGTLSEATPGAASTSSTIADVTGDSMPSCSSFSMQHAEATPPAEPEALHPGTLAPTRKVLSREGSRPAMLKHSLSMRSMDSEIGEREAASPMAPPMGPPKGMSGFIPRPPADARSARQPPQGPKRGASSVEAAGLIAPAADAPTVAAPAVEPPIEAECAVLEKDKAVAEPPEPEPEEDSAYEAAIANMRAERESHATREMAGLQKWLSAGRLDLSALPADGDAAPDDSWMRGEG